MQITPFSIRRSKKQVCFSVRKLNVRSYAVSVQLLIMMLSTQINTSQNEEIVVADDGHASLHLKILKDQRAACKF